MRIFNHKTASTIAIFIFNFVFTYSAFSQSGDVPNTARGVLGRGYDLTGSYAEPLEIKRQILDLNRLIADQRVERNYNIERADFSTVKGSNIAEYMSDLTSGTGLTMGGGLNIFSFSASFSREARNRFSSTSANRQEYEFATRISKIIKGAYSIENDNLSRYVNPAFVNDVNSMTPEQIIERYGTHVMLGALLGARLDYNLSARRISQTVSTNVESLVNTSFDLRFRGAGGSANHTSDLQRRFGSEYDINNLIITTNNIGGRSEFAQAIHNDPSPQSYDAWINSINENNIVWIDYYPNTLVPLYDLIVTELFGSNTQRLKDALRDAIFGYWGISGSPLEKFERDLANIKAASTGTYTVTLTGDIDLSNSINFSGFGNKTIIIQGDSQRRTITNYSTDTCMLLIPRDLTVVLGNNITLNGNSRPNASIVLVSNGRFEMREGSIITNGDDYGVLLNLDTTSSFTLTGGTISNSRNGVRLNGNGNSFTMNGGTITNNTFSGVSVYRGGQFTLTGGNITNNRYSGVYVSGTFNMTGGTISGNSSSSNGGGVQVGSGQYLGNGVTSSGGRFTMQGGVISNNAASDRGGGVYIGYNGTFIKNGGTIDSTNRASIGRVVAQALGSNISTNTRNRNSAAGPSVNIDTRDTGRRGWWE